jgi:hypothetical protein
MSPYTKPESLRGYRSVGPATQATTQAGDKESGELYYGAPWYMYLIPIYGGYRDIRDIFEAEASIGDQFKDHPFITTLRVGAAAFDWFPLIRLPKAIAMGVARGALKTSLKTWGKDLVFRPNKTKRAARDKVLYGEGKLGGAGDIAEELGPELSQADDLDNWIYTGTGEASPRSTQAGGAGAPIINTPPAAPSPKGKPYVIPPGSSVSTPSPGKKIPQYQDKLYDSVEANTLGKAGSDERESFIKWALSRATGEGLPEIVRSILSSVAPPGARAASRPEVQELFILSARDTYLKNWVKFLDEFEESVSDVSLHRRDPVGRGLTEWDTGNILPWEVIDDLLGDPRLRHIDERFLTQARGGEGAIEGMGRFMTLARHPTDSQIAEVMKGGIPIASLRHVLSERMKSVQRAIDNLVLPSEERWLKDLPSTIFNRLTAYSDDADPRLLAIFMEAPSRRGILQVGDESAWSSKVITDAVDLIGDAIVPGFSGRRGEYLFAEGGSGFAGLERGGASESVSRWKSLTASPLTPRIGRRATKTDYRPIVQTDAASTERVLKITAKTTAAPPVIKQAVKPPLDDVGFFSGLLKSLIRIPQDVLVNSDVVNAAAVGKLSHVFGFERFKNVAIRPGGVLAPYAHNQRSLAEEATKRWAKLPDSRKMQLARDGLKDLIGWVRQGNPPHTWMGSSVFSRLRRGPMGRELHFEQAISYLSKEEQMLIKALEDRAGDKKFWDGLAEQIAEVQKNVQKQRAAKVAKKAAPEPLAQREARADMEFWENRAIETYVGRPRGNRFRRWDRFTEQFEPNPSKTARRKWGKLDPEVRKKLIDEEYAKALPEHRHAASAKRLVQEESQRAAKRKVAKPKVAKPDTPEPGAPKPRPGPEDYEPDAGWAFSFRGLAGIDGVARIVNLRFLKRYPGQEVGEGVKQYQATISFRGLPIPVGLYETPEEAARAVSRMAGDPEAMYEGIERLTRLRQGYHAGPELTGAARRESKVAQAKGKAAGGVEEELSPTRDTRRLAGPIYERMTRWSSILARWRSNEAADPQTATYVRQVIQDSQVMMDHWFEQFAGSSKGKWWSGWVGEVDGEIRVLDEGLDRVVGMLQNGDYIEVFDAVRATGRSLDDVADEFGLPLVTDKAIEIAKHLDDMYYQMAHQIRAIPEFQNMNIRGNYITWLREGMEDGDSSALVRKILEQFQSPSIQGRLSDKVPFPFARARSDKAPHSLSAWNSASQYQMAAIRVVNTQPALARVKVIYNAAEADARTIEEGVRGLQRRGLKDRLLALTDMMMLLRGTANDPHAANSEVISTMVDALSGQLNWTMREGQEVKYVAKFMGSVYWGLLFGRASVGIDQFTQFTNLAADVGGASTIRGITSLFQKSMTREGFAAGLQQVTKGGFTGASMLGGGIGAGLGFMFAGPMGAIIGASLIPSSRFVKGAVVSAIDPRLLRRLGISHESRVTRGVEFTNSSRKIVKTLEEVGWGFIDTAETILRGAAFAAGLDTAMRVGIVGQNEAIAYALRIVDKTQFTYDALARNKWFRQRVLGVIAAPLSSFPPKQGRFLRRMVTQDASDGVSSTVAMTRYLFYNGLIAALFRQGTHLALGEEMVPRSLQGRIEPVFLPYGIKAPEGFEAVLSFSPTRTPGPSVALAVSRLMESDDKVADFFDVFVRTFMPYNLVVDNAVRGRQRIKSGAVRQKEGWQQQLMQRVRGERDFWTVPGPSTGAYVRGTTTAREVGRLFSFVDPEEAVQRDLEERTRKMSRAEYAEDRRLREQVEAILRDRPKNAGELLQGLAMTPAGVRAIAKGGISKSTIEDMSMSSLRRAWDRNVKYKQNLAMAIAQNRPGVREQVRELGLNWSDMAHLAEVYKILSQSQGGQFQGR